VFVVVVVTSMGYFAAEIHDKILGSTSDMKGMTPDMDGTTAGIECAPGVELVTPAVENIIPAVDDITATFGSVATVLDGITFAEGIAPGMRDGALGVVVRVVTPIKGTNPAIEDAATLMDGIIPVLEGITPDVDGNRHATE